MKLNFFFCQFPNPWALRVSEMGGYTSKCEKKSKSLHPTVQYVLKLQVYSCMHAFLEKMKVKKRENTDLLLGEAVLEAHDVLHFQLGLQL